VWCGATKGAPETNRYLHRTDSTVAEASSKFEACNAGVEDGGGIEKGLKEGFRDVATHVEKVGAIPVGRIGFGCRNDFINERLENVVFLVGLFSELVVLGARLLKLRIGLLRRSQLSIQICAILQDLVPIVRHCGSGNFQSSL
jgi:hypothetical protein